jgi:F-box/leucine-rich repeat protein 2/20
MYFSCAHSSGYLTRSPSLKKINLAYLHSVTQDTILAIALHCHGLLELNVNRCKNLEASGLLALVSIEILRASHLRGMNDEVWEKIVDRYGISLVVLDVSYSTGLTDAGFSTTKEIILPRLRHLNLSGCQSLTDLAMGFLSSGLPRIEYLEMARMGTRFRSPGLVQLFKRICVTLKRVDLEEGLLLKDEVLLALIPDDKTRDILDPRGEQKDLEIKVGVTNLEVIIITSCPALTDSGIRALCQASTNLRSIEADSTKMSERTALEVLARVISSSTLTKKEGLLSVLDSRLVAKKLQLASSAITRTRFGNRHYSFSPFSYHDSPTLSHSSRYVDEEGGGGAKLAECDERKIVLRSWLGNLEVDEADAKRVKHRLSRDGGREKGHRNQCWVS